MKRIPVAVVLEKDGEVHDFPSIRAASRFLKITPGEVSMSIHTCRGWKIKFDGPRIPLKDLKCKVFMFNLDGEFLQEFPSVHECARFVNVKPNYFIHILKNSNGKGHGRGQYGDFMFRYKKDNPDTWNPADFA